MIKIIGQNYIWNKLVSVYKKKRIANAYLFYGPEGTGKEGVSIKFAALLNCENEIYSPCGSCNSCLKVYSFQHPNISLIIPLPKEKTLNKEDSPNKALSNKTLGLIGDLSKEKVKNPYLGINIPNADTILINSIREIRKNIYLKSFEKGFKCILIFEAEKLMSNQGESANALLKILEEPPQNSIFILCTQFPHKLSYTIKSRCQSIYFPVLEDDEIIGFLFEKHHIEKDKAQIISNLSHGNIKLANEIALNDFSEIKNLILSLVKDITSSEVNWKKLINEFSKKYKTNPEEIKLNFKLLSFWFRDSFYISRFNDDSKLIFSTLAKEIVFFSNKYPNANYSKILKLIDLAIDNINKNIQLNLVLLNLMIDINENLNGTNK